MHIFIDICAGRPGERQTAVEVQPDVCAYAAAGRYRLVGLQRYFPPQLWLTAADLQIGFRLHDGNDWE